jgi:DHA1 family bicyclomycin/chloramphenicol resistance-like MFS transporter
MSAAPRHAAPLALPVLAVILAGLAMIGPFTIDPYPPAFPDVAADLQATPAQMQQTLSLYLFAVALMTLFHGTLSDSFGRRPVILASLLLYVVTAAGCALATSLPQLLFWRALPAPGSSSAARSSATASRGTMRSA